MQGFLAIRSLGTIHDLGLGCLVVLVRFCGRGIPGRDGGERFRHLCFAIGDIGEIPRAE
jgi:hypothetical protein